MDISTSHKTSNPSVSEYCADLILMRSNSRHTRWLYNIHTFQIVEDKSLENPEWKLRQLNEIYGFSIRGHVGILPFSVKDTMQMSLTCYCGLMEDDSSSWDISDHKTWTVYHELSASCSTGQYFVVPSNPLSSGRSVTYGISSIQPKDLGEFNKLIIHSLLCPLFTLLLLFLSLYI